MRTAKSHFRPAKGGRLKRVDPENTNIFRFPVPSKDPLTQKLSTLLSGALGYVLMLNRLNSIYGRIDEKEDTLGFIDETLSKLKVEYDVSEDDLASVPQSGSLLVVANHPFGGIEGLILGSLLLGVRSDTKIMANYLLGRIPELRQILLCVDPFETKASLVRNLKPLRDGIGWLKAGHALAAFPAGSVSHVDLRRRRIVDPGWHQSVARMAQKSQSAVLPVFFDGSNSLVFQLAGMVHPKLRTALLPHEFLNKGRKTIKVRIGNVIPYDKVLAFDTDDKLVTYLRMRTYALKYRCREAAGRGLSTMLPSKPSKNIPKTVAPAVDSHVSGLEADRLPREQVLLDSDEYCVLYGKAHQMPNLLFEIGRLREMTFRQAGEGTGRPVDLDRFDLYYTHLFVWNKAGHEVVGAYRLGPVEPILQRFGKNGLYTGTLFQYKEQFLEHIRTGIELGRSFVRVEYQRLYAPLLLLWKGIARFVALHPEYTILFGPVSISDDYSILSKRLMVSYLTVNHYAPDLARLIRPRTPAKGQSLKRLGLDDLVNLPDDIEGLSAMISEIESDRKGVPVLLRQYVKMGGRLMGFNLDPSFGRSLDGLILVDLLKCDRKVLGRYMGKEGAEGFFGYHSPDQSREDLAS